MSTYITYNDIYVREQLLKQHPEIVEHWADRSDNQLTSLARSKGVYSINQIETDPLDTEIVEYLELWVIEKCLIGSGGINNVNAVDTDDDAYFAKMSEFYKGSAEKQASKISYGMLIGIVDEPVKTAQVLNRYR